MATWRQVKAWFAEREMVKQFHAMTRACADYENGIIGYDSLCREHHRLDGLGLFKGAAVLIAVHAVRKLKGKN